MQSPKTLNVVLTASVFAMILCGPPHLRRTTTLASALNPEATSTVRARPQSVAAYAPDRPGLSSPVLSPEGMARLKARAMEETKLAPPLSARLVQMLGIGTDAPPSKQIMISRAGTKHLMAVSLKPGADDIIFTVNEPGINHVYLTDSSRVLRAAVDIDAHGYRSVSLNDAGPGYQNPLRAWGEVANPRASATQAPRPSGQNANTMASATQAPTVLTLYCEADEVNPDDPNGNQPGPYRPRSVTLRIDLGARTVDMRDRGELIASQSGVVVTDAAYNWGAGRTGLNTWQGGVPRISNFDGTLDRMGGHVVVQWDVGVPPGGGQYRWRYRGFAGRCRLADVPKY